MSEAAEALEERSLAASEAAPAFDTAMVLAAGRGERMRPLTLSAPKPLLPVLGQTLIDRILDRLARQGVERAVVNLHYLGEQLERHLGARTSPRIELSPEAELLETGGGVRAALPRLGDKPFYVINGDVLWLEGHEPALRRLAAQWDETRMDALLLVHPTTLAVGYEGPGDFSLTPDGQVRRRTEREVAPFVYAGILVAHPRFYAAGPEGAFSTNLLFDRAIEAERLFAVRHDGEWFHVGTPAALAEAEEILRSYDFPSQPR